MGVYGQSGTPITGSPPACRVFHSTTQSIATGTETSLAFDSERFDTDAMHDTVTNNSRITIKTAGVYVVTVNLAFVSNATGLRLVAIRLNGGTYLGYVNNNAVNGDNHNLHISTIYKFAANDYIEVRVIQSSGGALNVGSGVASTPEFAAAWMGLGT